VKKLKISHVTFFLDSNLQIERFRANNQNQKKNFFHTFNSSFYIFNFCDIIYYSNTQINIIIKSVKLIHCWPKSIVVCFIKFSLHETSIFTELLYTTYTQFRQMTPLGRIGDQRSACRYAVYQPEVIFIVALNSMQRRKLYARYFARFASNLRNVFVGQFAKQLLSR